MALIKEKKKSASIKEIKKRFKVQHVRLRCFQKEVFTTFEENLAFDVL